MGHGRTLPFLCLRGPLPGCPHGPQRSTAGELSEQATGDWPGPSSLPTPPPPHGPVLVARFKRDIECEVRGACRRVELIRPPALHSALPAPRSLSPAGLSAAGAGSPPWCDRVPAPSRETRCHRRRSVSIRGVTASTPARPDTRLPPDGTLGRAAAGARRKGSGPRPPSPCTLPSTPGSKP